MSIRSRHPGQKGRLLSPATIKKELVTLRIAWIFAVDAKLVEGNFPSKVLRYAKTEEKPCFQTFAEIERQIAAGGLTSAQIDDLWDSLFLTLDEIERFLAEVKGCAHQPFIFPMIAFAAHTGARRGEVIRALHGDVDLQAGMITIRERKRRKRQRSTRSVPISAPLAKVITEWLTIRPMDRFCSALTRLAASNSHHPPRDRILKTRYARQISNTSKVGMYFGTRSFRTASPRELDQRIIDEWVGHTQEEETAVATDTFRNPSQKPPFKRCSSKQTNHEPKRISILC